LELQRIELLFDGIGMVDERMVRGGGLRGVGEYHIGQWEWLPKTSMYGYILTVTYCCLKTFALPLRRV
jgi:hypothetical protein